MWDPEPDEVYTVGLDSRELGQPCAICGEPLQVRDQITWRPWPPDPDVDGYEVRAVHLTCLRLAEARAAREGGARPGEG